MDTRTHQGQQVDVEGQIAIIKQHMPQTYQAIQDKAKEIGKDAYALVRRGIKGEPNCFYAIEAGHVVGGVFNAPGINDQIAGLMCQFGCRHLVMWGRPEQSPTLGQANQGAAHGAA